MIPGANPLQAASNQVRQQLLLNRQVPGPMQADANALRAAEAQQAAELYMREQGQALRAANGPPSPLEQQEGYARQAHNDEVIQQAAVNAAPHLHGLGPGHPLNVLVQHLAHRAYMNSLG